MSPVQQIRHPRDYIRGEWIDELDAAWQAVSKRHPSEAQTPAIVIPAPLSVIPAKAGIQAGWSGLSLNGWIMQALEKSVPVP